MMKSLISQILFKILRTSKTKMLIQENKMKFWNKPNKKKIKILDIIKIEEKVNNQFKIITKLNRMYRTS